MDRLNRFSVQVRSFLSSVSGGLVIALFLMAQGCIDIPDISNMAMKCGPALDGSGLICTVIPEGESTEMGNVGDLINAAGVLGRPSGAHVREEPTLRNVKDAEMAKEMDRTPLIDCVQIGMGKDSEISDDILHIADDLGGALVGETRIFKVGVINECAEDVIVDPDDFLTTLSADPKHAQDWQWKDAFPRRITSGGNVVLSIEWKPQAHALSYGSGASEVRWGGANISLWYAADGGDDITIINETHESVVYHVLGMVVEPHCPIAAFAMYKYDPELDAVIGGMMGEGASVPRYTWIELDPSASYTPTTYTPTNGTIVSWIDGWFWQMTTPFDTVYGSGGLVPHENAQRPAVFLDECGVYQFTLEVKDGLRKSCEVFYSWIHVSCE